MTHFVALQHRDFRLLWFGRLFSSTGSQMQQIAISWHIYDLLRGGTYTVTLLGREFSLDAGALGLGSLGLARVIPVILFALIGGVLADNRDRRTLLIWVQSAAALFSATLAYLTLSGQVTMLHIYLLSMAGAATALFGLSSWFGLSYALFALTGAGDTVSTVVRGTLRQVTTPDRLRGRMTSVNMIFFMGGPQLGEVEAGVVAALFSAPLAIVTGGLATLVLTAMITWRYPTLRQYEAPE